MQNKDVFVINTEYEQNVVHSIRGVIHDKRCQITDVQLTFQFTEQAESCYYIPQ